MTEDRGYRWVTDGLPMRGAIGNRQGIDIKSLFGRLPMVTDYRDFSHIARAHEGERGLPVTIGNRGLIGNRGPFGNRADLAPMPGKAANGVTAALTSPFSLPTEFRGVV